MFVWGAQYGPRTDTDHRRYQRSSPHTNHGHGLQNPVVEQSPRQKRTPKKRVFGVRLPQPRLLPLGGQGVLGNGAAVERWPNVLFLPCDLHWGCDRRHSESESRPTSADRQDICDAVISINRREKSVLELDLHRRE